MIKKNGILFSLLLAALFFYSCQNNDAVILQEFKQQNEFLEEQYKFNKSILDVQGHSYSSEKAFADLFLKQDSVMRLFLEKLNSVDKNNVDSEFTLFKKQSDVYFEKTQQNNRTKLMEEDRPLLYFKNDTVPKLIIANDSLKKQLIKQHILRRYFIISQLYHTASTFCGIRFDNPNRFGYRLTIEKNDHFFQLNLKCYSPGRFPHFENLEFVSLSKNNKGDYDYQDELTDIKSEVSESKYEKDAIIIKTKPLHIGFYRIYCNKLSISDNGRLIKQAAEFDFEITDNQ